MSLRLTSEAFPASFPARVEALVMEGASGTGEDAESGDRDRPPERDTEKEERFREKLAPRLRLMISRRFPSNLKGRIDVEDILQDAYLRLSKSLATRRPNSDEELRSWFFRAVWNEWQDQRKRHGAMRRDVGHEGPIHDGHVARLITKMGVSTSYRLHEAIDRIRRAVTPRDWAIVELRASDGQRWKEIADTVKLTPEAARKRYIRALEEIRKVVSSPLIP